MPINYWYLLLLCLCSLLFSERIQRKTFQETPYSCSFFIVPTLSCWISLTHSGIILCMCPANERWLYSLTPSHIGWTNTKNDPCTFRFRKMDADNTFKGIIFGWKFSCFNSLVPGRSGCDFKNSNFILVLFVCIFRSSHDNALGWIP